MADDTPSTDELLKLGPDSDYMKTGVIPSREEYNKELAAVTATKDSGPPPDGTASPKPTPAEPQGESQLTVRQPKGESAFFDHAAKPEPLPAPTPETPAPETPPPKQTTYDIYGRHTIFHYNYDRSPDKYDKNPTSFFGYNLDDINLVGAAVPVDILEAQFGKFTQKLPDGTYTQLNTPEAQEAIARIKASHVSVKGEDGQEHSMPIVDIQGSFKNWHRAIDFTYGAAQALGIKDDGYISYQVVASDGTPVVADPKWSDSSPLGEVRKKMGSEYSDVSDAAIMGHLHDTQYPDMPRDTFDAAMRDDQGAGQLAQYRQQPKSPIEQIRAAVPELKDVSDQDLIAKLYSDRVHQGKIDPAKFSFEDFRDQVKPPSAGEQLFRFFLTDEDVPGLKPFQAGSHAAASAQTHAMSAQAYNVLPGIGQAGAAMGHMIPGFDQARDQVDKWLKRQTPGHKDYVQALMGYLTGMANAQQKQAEADQARAREASTTGGKIGQVVGAAGSGMGLSLATYMNPGMSLRAGLAVASLFEGASTYAGAIQAGHENAALEAIDSAGSAALLRYWMQAPVARLTSAGVSVLSGAGQDTVSKLLTGQKVDWTEESTRSLIDISLPLIAGGNVPKMERPVSLPEFNSEVTASDVLGPETPFESAWRESPLVIRRGESPWTPQSLLTAARGLPEKATPEEMSRQAGMMSPPMAKEGQVFLVGSPETIRQKTIVFEAKAAHDAKNNGDTPQAVRHMDKAMAMKTPKEQKAVAKTVIKVSHDLADNRNGGDPKPLSKPEQLAIDAYAGLSQFDLDEGETPQRALDEHLTVNGAEAQKEHSRPELGSKAYNPNIDYKGRSWNAPPIQSPEIPDVLRDLPHVHEKWRAMSPQDRGTYLNDIYKASGYPLYSGIDLGVITRGVESGLHALGESELGQWQKRTLDPGSLSEGAAQMRDISAGRTSEAKYARTALPSEIAKAMQLDRVLRGAEKVGARRHFWAKFTKQQLRDMKIAHEEGRSTGNAAADRFFQFYDSVAQALYAAETKGGMRYEARDTYMYHALKNDRQRQQFEQWYNQLVAADPRFTYRRALPTWREVYAHGMEPVSENPEDLVQMRLYQHANAMRKIMTLREAQARGLAFNTKRKDLGPGIKAWGDPVRAPNGDNYYVLPEAQAVLKNAWDQAGVYQMKGPVGMFFRGLSLTKGVSVTWKLGWSFVHAKHITKMSLTNAFSQMTQIATAKGLTGAQKGEMVSDVLTRFFQFGHASSPEVQTWQGNRAQSTLSTDQKTNIQHAKWAGLDFSMNQEREIQFLKNWRDMAPGLSKVIPRGTSDVIRLGYDWLSSAAWQKYFFGTMIPQMKFDAFVTMRDMLIKKHPELLDEKNLPEFKHELVKTGKEIEARFGEMFYDNLLWKKTWKDVGTSMLLSLGWQLSAFRIYGGAVHDTSALVGNLLKGQEGQITDRMLFGLWYTGLNMAEAGLITYMSNKLFGGGGDPIPKGMDWVFPRIGKNDDGSDKRVSPVEFSREWATWNAHVNEHGGYLSPGGVVGGTYEMAKNKLNPVLSTIDSVLPWENKNFYGQQIVDPNDNQLQQWGEVVKYAINNTFAPISIQPLIDKTGRQDTWVDTVYAAVGFPRAASWTGRTPIQNQIVSTYQRLNPHVTTEEHAAASKMDSDLRQALREGRDTSQMEENMLSAGVNKGTITYIKRHLDETVDKRMWKQLPVEEQRKILGRMSQEERAQYLPMAHKKLKTELQ